MTDILSRKEALLKEQEALKMRRREINLELGKIEDELLREQERKNTKVGKYYKNTWSGELIKIISYNVENGNYHYLGLQVSSYENGNWNVSFDESKTDIWALSQGSEYTEISEEEFMSALQNAVDYTTPFYKTLQNYNCLGAKE